MELGVLEMPLPTVLTLLADAVLMDVAAADTDHAMLSLCVRWPLALSCCCLLAVLLLMCQLNSSQVALTCGTWPKYSPDVQLLCTADTCKQGAVSNLKAL